MAAALPLLSKTAAAVAAADKKGKEYASFVRIRGIMHLIVQTEKKKTQRDPTTKEKIKDIRLTTKGKINDIRKTKQLPKGNKTVVAITAVKQVTGPPNAPSRIFHPLIQSSGMTWRISKIWSLKQCTLRSPNSHLRNPNNHKK